MMYYGTGCRAENSAVRFTQPEGPANLLVSAARHRHILSRVNPLCTLTYLFLQVLPDYVLPSVSTFST